MMNVWLTLLDLAVVTAKLCGPGGVRAVIAENLVLKRQLLVLRRGRERAPNLRLSDRLLFGVESLFLSPGRMRKLAIAVRPSTLLAFHQALVRRKYCQLFSSRPWRTKPGPKGPDEGLVRAIVELKSRNPRFGCPRIARIISHTFGIDIDKNVVHRVLAKHYRPAPGGTGPSWLSFIGYATDGLWSVDLFRCESLVLRTYWVLVVMDHFTRRLVGIGVHAGAVTGVDLCCMFNAAIHGQGVPRYLSTDHDPLFEAHRWQANWRTCGFLRLMNSRRCRMCPAHTRSSSELSGPSAENFLTMSRSGMPVTWNGSLLSSKPITTRHAATPRWKDMRH